MFRIERDEWIKDVVRLMLLSDAVLTAEDAQALAQALWERPLAPASSRSQLSRDGTVRRVKTSASSQSATAHQSGLSN